MSGCLDGLAEPTLSPGGALRQRDLPHAVAVLAREAVAAVRGERRKVDRSLGIGGQDDEHVTLVESGERAPRTHERERALQAADVERVWGAPYDQSMIAVFLESGELQRLYTGLSLLVSAASDGRPARALVGFGALAPMLDEQLTARALRPDGAPDVSDGGRDGFARTLAELRDTAIELEECRMWACAAAVEATGVSRADIEARLDGVLSTPRFLREVAGADLVVV
jgi:peroxiredoxin family protein